MTSKTTEVETRLSPLVELKLSAGFGTGEFTGYASTWGGPPDSYGTTFAKGAFAKTITDHQREKTSPVMLWAHKRDEIIGKWTDVREDDYGLLVTGKVNLETSRGRDAYSHLKQGDLTGLSVGVFLNPRDIKHGPGVSEITRADVFEISVVGFPANRRARITQVRSVASKAELVEILRDSGIPKVAAARIAGGGWPALSNGEEDKIRTLADLLDQQTRALRSAR